MTVFVPMDMTEDVVKWDAQRRSGSAEPGGTDLEVLQEWIINSGDQSKTLPISVEYFLYLLANQNPPWATYRSFMSFHLMPLDKLPGVHLRDIKETWRQLFSKCVLKFMGPEVTHVCKDDQMCAGLKSLIDQAAHGAQYIWDAKSTE